MSRLATLLALALLLPPLHARAEEEGAADEKRLEEDSAENNAESGHAKKSKSKRKVHTAEEELAEEKDPLGERLTNQIDDPHTGFSAEAAGSLALLDKSYGPGPLITGAAGVRVDYAPGRLWAEPSDDFWRYALLAELAYDYTQLTDGTQRVNTTTRYHYLNGRGLLGYPAKHGAILLYGALGGGATIESVTYRVNTTTTPLTGVKPNFDYGAGFRLLVELAPQVSLSARVELMRFRRQYMDDTFLTLTAGAYF